MHFNFCCIFCFILLEEICQEKFASSGEMKQKLPIVQIGTTLLTRDSAGAH